MNSIGNYTPQNVKNLTKPIQPNENLASLPTGQAGSDVKKVSIGKQENLTTDEKKFFARLYPNNESEVVDYHFYERNGKLSGVKIGSLIDKRG
jgi:hypothetical protein